MVAFNQNLSPGQLADLAKILQGVLHVHGPAQIPGQQHHILFADPGAPILTDPLKMALPMRTKHIHGLDIPAGQMQIPYGVNRQIPFILSGAGLFIVVAVLVLFLILFVVKLALGVLAEGLVIDIAAQIQLDLVH